MSRSVTVVTPENIEVTYHVAGFASRFVATVIDVVIQLVVLLLIEAVLGWFARTLGSVAGFLGSLATAASILTAFLILFFYAVFFEMIWGGRTPGKRLLGLRVIRDGGYPINLVASVIRNVLRFIDFGMLPLMGGGIVLFGLPGMISIFFSPRYKRIGDYAAGTLVIVERAPEGFDSGRHLRSSNALDAYLPLVKNLDRLTVDEYRLLRRFVSRRPHLELMVQAAIAESIAIPILCKLEIEVQVQYQLQFAEILAAIERRYAEEHGVL